MTRTNVSLKLNQLSISENGNDFLGQLLSAQIKQSTKGTYQRALDAFAYYLLIGKVSKPRNTRISSELMLNRFLRLDSNEANEILFNYVQDSLEANLTPNTINLRVKAVKALCGFARKLGHYAPDIYVKNLPTRIYRDTSGCSVEKIKAVLASIDRTTIKGKRDYAIWVVLFELGLRREELCQLDIGDLDPKNKTLSILGKGKFEKQLLSLSNNAVEAINDWLKVYYQPHPEKPLFISLARRNNGERFTGNALWRMINSFSDIIGQDFSPHKVRHSSITAVLNESDGNLRIAQKHSRHSSPTVLMIYDDNRQEMQRRATNLLSNLIS